ncbi:MAG TPA: GH92 family glycosyl hydrolase [Puia sp.]|nr:GH92 family glycosyl hydrolase [Puia sp.]
MKLAKKMGWCALIGVMLSAGKGFGQGNPGSAVRSPASRGNAGTQSTEGVDPVSYVDPFIGTGKSNVFTRWGSEGGTYPGAVAPWGMMQLTPETRANGGYDHGDSTLYFFSCFHHLSGYPGGSAGQIKIMPLAGGVVPIETSAAWSVPGRPFLHQDEKASPGYYKVTFTDDHSMTEVTASGRVGWFRFTFPEHVVPRIFVGGMGTLTRTGSHSLQGAALPVVLRYDRNDSGEDSVKEGKVLRFTPAAEGPTVIVFQISVSTVSPESAKKNIDAETAGLGFDQVKKRTEGLWRKELSVVGIADSNEEKKKIFYTALYHSLLLPWVISDVEGKYRGRDGKVHSASGKNEYGQFSPWDTFRSLHPLLCLLFPERQQDMILSMLDIYRQTGHLPTDPMTGNHAVPVIVDSWLKGIRGFDPVLAYNAMKKSLVEAPFLQSDMEVYHRQGYIPFTYPESVTRTVEYAYDDWTLGQFVDLVLHRKEEAEIFLKRSYSYRNLFNPADLFLLPRDGSRFNLQPGTTGYKEGDKWVYSFFVPQHVRDLINLMGGEDAFAVRLDSALADQSIVFDNETVFHIPYLFNDAGRPDRTQYWIRTIMDKRFSTSPGGLPGNDDLGSVSSWYVLSAMGIFPVCPGRPVYAIGSPLFREMTLHLRNGKQFIIRRRGAGSGNGVGSGVQSAENIYVKSLWVNNKKVDGLLLPHAVIGQGGEMVFEMSPTPVKAGAVGKEGDSARQGSFGGRAYPREEAGVADPEFRLRDLSLSKKEVAPHELFWIRFSLSNQGGLGTKIVKLLVNGREVGHKNCLMAAGAERTDSIGCRLYPYGMAEVRIEGIPAVGVKVVRTGKGPEGDNKTGESAGLVEITGLAVRPMLRKGEGQKISFTAQNIGGDPHSFYIPVGLNDSVVRRDTLLLEPGEKRRVSQELAVTGEGMQTIGVMGMRGRFSVYSRNEGSILLDLSPGAAAGDSVVPDQSGFDNLGRVIPAGGVTQGKDGQARSGEDGGHSRGENGAGAGDSLHRRGAGRLLLGKDCYVEVSNSASLDSMGETLTMMAWVYPAEGGGDLVDLFAKGDNHVLQVVDNKSLSFFAGGWGRGDCTVDLPADWLGHWHHIAGVCEGNTLRLYIDGQQKGATRVEGRVNLSNTHRWTLGRNEEFPLQRIFNGYIDKVKVFEAPLTGEEIKGIVDKERLSVF